MLLPSLNFRNQSEFLQWISTHGSSCQNKTHYLKKNCEELPHIVYCLSPGLRYNSLPDKNRNTMNCVGSISLSAKDIVAWLLKGNNHGVTTVGRY
jgi:hypothetical protein